MKNKKIILLITFCFVLTSCSGTWQSVKRGITGQKDNSTDEFLVKKKDPLTLPPDFESLPKPDQEVRSKELKTSIKETLKGTSIEEVDDSAASVSSAEESILEKIKLK